MTPVAVAMAPTMAPTMASAVAPAIAVAPMPLQHDESAVKKASILQLESKLDVLTLDKLTHRPYEAILEWSCSARELEAYASLTPQDFAKLCWRRLDRIIQEDIKPLFPDNQLNPSTFEELYQCLFAAYGKTGEMGACLQVLLTPQRPWG